MCGQIASALTGCINGGDDATLACPRQRRMPNGLVAFCRVPLVSSNEVEISGFAGSDEESRGARIGSELGEGFGETVRRRLFVIFASAKFDSRALPSRTSRCLSRPLQQQALRASDSMQQP